MKNLIKINGEFEPVNYVAMEWAHDVNQPLQGFKITFGVTEEAVEALVLPCPSQS